MNTLVINGSPRKGNTHKVLEIINSKLIEKGYSSNYISITDYHIETCKGCYNCFLNGIEYCPLKDDVTILWNMITKADVVIIGSPVYALGIPGSFKNFMDRIAYNSHRPQFFSKPLVIIATTAGMGIKDILKQLSWFSILGFEIINSVGFLKYPTSEEKKVKIKKDNKTIEDIIEKIEIEGSKCLNPPNAWT